MLAILIACSPVLDDAAAPTDTGLGVPAPADSDGEGGGAPALSAPPSAVHLDASESGDTAAPVYEVLAHDCDGDASYVHEWPIDGGDYDGDSAYACLAWAPAFVAWYEAALGEVFPQDDYDCDARYAMFDDDGPVLTTCSYVDGRTDADPDAFAGFATASIELYAVPL